MSEKIIVVKSGTMAEKGDNKWVELIDHEDKTHSVFPSIQREDGEWHHLDKEVDMLKGYIESGTIENKSFKLTKEKKGKYYNVVAVEEIKGVFGKQAIAKVQSNREDSIEAQVAFKGMIELIVAGKLNNPAIEQATTDWAMARIALPAVIVTKVEEAIGETTKDNKGDKETQAEPADRQDSGETTESDAKRVEGFLNELKKHGIKDTRLWLDVEYGISQDAELTPKKCEILYKAIVKKGKW